MSEVNRDRNEIGSPNNSDDSWSYNEIYLENLPNFNELEKLLGLDFSGEEEKLCDILPIVSILDEMPNEINQEEDNSGSQEDISSKNLLSITYICKEILKDMPPNLDSLPDKSFPRNNEDEFQKNRNPEYEFADVEDNSKKYFDHKDLPNDAMALMKKGVDFSEGKERDNEARESMESTITVLPARSEADLLNDKNQLNTSSHTQSYNIGASCSHDRDPKHVSDLPVPAKSKESKFNIKMPTIDEVSELNRKINPLDITSSRPNPLKMKAKVKKIRKCSTCSVRLGFCGTRCQCGGYYCAKHRYENEHNCTFDYKPMEAEGIEKKSIPE